MYISTNLTKKHILLDLEASNKEEVLTILAQKASSLIEGVSYEDILSLLKEREELGSTAIGGGVAIPHVKIEGLEDIVIIVAISSAGVPFDSMDGEPVGVFFLLLAPDDATIDYLKTLANISRLVKKEGLLKALLDAHDVEKVLNIIKEFEFQR